MNSGTKPSFSVIIPSYNSTSTLPLTLASVPVDEHPDVEVIIVDDGSTDDCEVLYADAGARGARVIRGASNRGPAHARNIGARESTGEWLLFLDSDDTLLPTTFGQFARAIDPSVGLVEGGSLIGHGPDVQRGFLAGTFVVRREVFAEAGGYDETLRFSENSELSWRLQTTLASMGLGQRLVDDAVITISSVGTSRDYDEARMRAAIRILEIHADRMASDPLDRARHEAIAAVNAARLREWRTARQYALKAARSDPRNVRHHARLLAFVAHVPPRTERGGAVTARSRPPRPS